MRKRLEPWLQSIWYGDKPPPLLLRALAAAYGGLSQLRRGLYQRGWLKTRRVPVPVIVVGNLTVGGSGKTPAIMALARALSAHGLTPGIVSRGYGGHYRQAWRQVHADSDPAEVGDEPVLLARSSGVPVVVARRRIDGAQALLTLGCDLILADDGLQHHALGRDLEILVVHGQRRFGNQRLLPAGPLREARDADRFPLVLVNGGDALPGEHLLLSELGTAINLASGERRELQHWRGSKVLAFAGIADPQRFFDGLRQQHMDVQAHPFPDHHPFEPGDFGFAADCALDLLCTGKDAVKLRGRLPTELAQRIWEVPLHASLPQSLLSEVLRRLDQIRT